VKPFVPAHRINVLSHELRSETGLALVERDPQNVPLDALHGDPPNIQDLTPAYSLG